MKVPQFRRNGDGRGFAVYPGSKGRRKYFGRFEDPEAKRGYERWLSDLLAASAAGEPFQDDRRPDRSIWGLILDYDRWAEKYYAANGEPSGECRNVRETMALLGDFCGDDSASEFGPIALRRFQSHLATSGRFVRSTVNAHVNRVRRFFKWCQSRELVPRGLAEELATVEGLRRGKCSVRESDPIEPVPRAVWRATLPFLDPTLRAMVQIQFWAGMRPGEVCRMRPCDVDRSGSVWLYRPPQHKTAHRGRGLTKAIPQPAQGILAPWLNGSAEKPIFLTAKGKPFYTDLYGQSVRRAVRAAQKVHVPVEPWHPNQLRHAILTEIRDRFGEEAAQHWAGHARPDTTAIYTKKVEGILTRIATELAHPPES